MHHGLIFVLLFLAAGVGLKGPLLLIRLLYKRRASLKSPLNQEEAVRTVNCSYCGYRIEGADENELFDQLQIHVDHDHPELRLTGEQIEDLITSGYHRVEGTDGTLPGKATER